MAITGLYYTRQILEMTQQEIADKFGVTRQTVSTWEGGFRKIGKNKLSALSNMLNINEDLLNKVVDDVDKYHIIQSVLKIKKNEIQTKYGEKFMQLLEKQYQEG